jgi:hypothetical protein
MVPTSASVFQTNRALINPEPSFPTSTFSVKPLPVQKIQQTKPHQHLHRQRNVTISYVPLGKIELEDQKSSPAIQPGFSF